MTESIYGKFKTVHAASAAAAELAESGINDDDIIVDPSGLVVTVESTLRSGPAIRAIIEQHGGTTQVDEVSDPGMLPEDPMAYSDDSSGL